MDTGKVANRKTGPGAKAGRIANRVGKKRTGSSDRCLGYRINDIW